MKKLVRNCGVFEAQREDLGSQASEVCNSRLEHAISSALRDIDLDIYFSKLLFDRSLVSPCAFIDDVFPNRSSDMFPELNDE